MAGKYSILVVEDNDLNLKLVRTILQNGGYNVLEAMDAETGIKIARDHHPDMILMDIQLPGMDGLEATRVIKNDPALKDIMVVALTSFVMLADKNKALKAGCSGYITKPIDMNRFLHIIAQFQEPVDKDEPPIDQTFFDNYPSLQKTEMQALLSELTDLYLKDSKPLLQRLGRAIEDGDTDAMKKAAHSLKSSSGNIGALKLADLCQKIEEEVHKKSFENVGNTFSRIQLEYKRVQKELSEKRLKDSE